MHVDEVQIDGGSTEAVITGNMENPGKRLIVLEGDEVSDDFPRRETCGFQREPFRRGWVINFELGSAGGETVVFS